MPRRVALAVTLLLCGLALVPPAWLVALAGPLLLPLFAAPAGGLLAVWWVARCRARERLLDPLTGLANRQALLRAARAALRTPEGRVGLILLDVDRFRSVNDTLGHEAGDHLLTRFGHRLAPYAAAGAVVARLGGDEFAVLLPDAGSAAELERTALSLISELAAPIRVDGLELVLEASAGVAVHPDHGDDAESLIRHADVAMAHAQRAHTGVSVYCPSMNAGTALRLGLLGDLRTALESAELEVHYQPKVAFDGRVVGLEALVRWDRAGQGPVSPEEFVGLAETSGLMPHLTDYVLDTAVRQLAAWHAEGFRVQVAVNISPRDMLRPGFAASIAERLIQHQLPPSALQLEITERQLLEDARLAAETLEELRRRGVQTSLDDFGTGYSSLVRLRRLPVGELKIDRSFVSRMVADESDAAVVRCSVQLAHSLGLTAVAEGVEDDETWERLARMGCDAVQGWLVSAAMPAAQATAWLRVRAAGPGDNAAAASCTT
jgi:diguanylate cyclase (GGDEF)-like protein